MRTPSKAQDRDGFQRFSPVAILSLQIPSLLGRALAFFITLAVAGCGHFIRLKHEVRRLESDSRLNGRVTVASGRTGHVVIAVITHSSNASLRFLDLAILAPWETEFVFSVPPFEGLKLIAFLDENDDGIFQDNEPLWLSKELTADDRDADRRLPVQDVVLQSGRTISRELLLQLQEARAGRQLEVLAGGHQIRTSLGLIENFGSPRFTRDAASMGFWEPVEFMNQHGVGIYFLEPYDPNRVPVLLIHGAVGTPGDWKSLVPMLDPSKHQIWLFAYPSGLRLADSAKILEAAIERLHQRYGFSRLDVIAHSMGGLVAREFLLKEQEDGLKYPGLFITLSTPWSGHESASLGVKYAPTAIPCWLDLQSGSEFQTRLFERSLPNHRPYHLAFSFRGSDTFVLPDSNDGVVSIASELAYKAQREARSIRGFDETHTSILSSPETAAWINELLASTVAKP